MSNLKRFVLFCCLLPALLPAQGIAFQPGKWSEALAKAKQEHKWLFLDAYTTWCGPCKQMSSKVFPDTLVGAFFNARFINVKMDMEKGEGVDMATKYGIEYYPTLLFFDGDGMLQHKAVGFHSTAEFLTLGQKALDPAQNLKGLKTRYQNGDRSTDLLWALTETKAGAAESETGAIAEEYLKTQTDLTTEANMDFILRYVDDPFSPGFKYLVGQRSLFVARFREKAVEAKIESVFENYLQQHPKMQLGEVQRLYATAYPERGERLASAYRLGYYRQRGEAAKFAEAAIDHYTRYPTTDADELNEIAWLFYETVDDTALLKKALKWAQASVEIQESCYNRDTMARLYAKLGQEKKALKHAKRAIELAKTNGEDSSEMEAFLKELNR